MSTLQADSILKSYGDQQILTDVFIRLQRGEIIGLLGRNGAGKSTLLKIIFGCIEANSKYVKVDDKLIRNVGDAHRCIHYLPQHHFLPDHVWLITLIQLFCKRAEVNFLFNHHLIKPHLNEKISALSGGERRMIEVLLTICSKAPFILLDEPFNGIAPVHKSTIKNLIKDKSADKGFIITGHDYRNILDIATRKVLLHDGYTQEIEHVEELKRFGYLP